ncbi:Cobalt-zinc-cadmium resistance protein CzcB [Roseimaritima multifibrata]|uniref:Cobalt-zinc-cadmium resistance protein CzcB n=1 Tax=Roseimaritima multifibrata TaxID=1930274 RepID=A0A517M9E4_9BACT|nr:efflux RND transporter periplasmic adaptor subunit [Roseimaritima multifibrata]QDS91499.1 Cobalt-zinc-cadmium resistance protein CzcB [Roseimaritima multifibrata]
MKSKHLISAIIALALVCATGWFAWKSLGNGSQKPHTDSVSEAPNDQSAGDPSIATGQLLVRLSEAKQAIAGIQTEPVRQTTLQLTRTLPGRFAYDDAHHVALRTPTDGVLESVLVKTGDSVSVGQPVAVLRSPAIGVARGQILTRQTELDLARKAYYWEADIHDGVSETARLIADGEPVATIKKRLQGKTLGDFGGQLLTAYSKSELAKTIATSIDSVSGTGAVSGRVVQQRQSEVEQTTAALESAIEQSLFQTQQSKAKAEAAVNAAERELQIAKQTLSTLLGATARATSDEDISPNTSEMSRLTITSPLAGTVESKTFSATERVTAQDELFVIADTSRLWVEADIRGRDWDSINVAAGSRVMVTTPSVNVPPQAATLYYVGRQVDPSSGSIPLVATIDNTAGHFRPGLFARVAVPTETIQDAIVIPESALVDLDGQESVFVRQQDNFLPVAVEVGSRSGDQVEIRKGLTVGQTVVVSGVFTLKSERMLVGEE